MTKTSLEQYITDIRNGLEQMSMNLEGAGRTIEVRFGNNSIKLEGKVVVAFTLPGGKINVRVSYYDYIGNRKDSITIKDMAAPLVCSQIANFIHAKESEIMKINSELVTFRQILWERYLSKDGFSRECDSKYMTVFSKGGTNLTFKFSDTHYAAEISNTRKKGNINVYTFKGDIDTSSTAEYAKILAACKMTIK